MYLGTYGEENPRSSSTSRVASVYRWRWVPKAVESVLALMPCERSAVLPEGIAGGVLDGGDDGGVQDGGGVGGGAMALTRSWEGYARSTGDGRLLDRRMVAGGFVP
jgi:hypothetical protein